MRNTDHPVHILEELNAVSYVAYMDVKWRDFIVFQCCLHQVCLTDEMLTCCVLVGACSALLESAYLQWLDVVHGANLGIIGSDLSP